MTAPGAVPPVEFTTAARLSTPFTRVGRGKPLLLIHSLGGSLHSWKSIQAELATTADVAAYDWGGHGYGEEPPPHTSMADLGNQAGDLIAELFNVPTILVGVAAGAAIAMHTALARPELVSAMLLASPTACVPSAGADGMRARGRQVMEHGMRSAVDASIAAAFTQRFAAANPTIITGYQHEFLAVSPRAYARSSAAFAEHDVIDRLSAIKAPAILLPGEWDPYFPPSHAERIHEIRPDWPVQLLPGVGHYAHLETPTRVISAARSLLTAGGDRRT